MENSIDREESFSEIYEKHSWDGETRSGNGSDLANTQFLREDYQRFLKDEGIKSILDIGCGEFNWQQHLDFTGIDVIGIDIVSEVVETLTNKFPQFSFIHHDMVESAPDIQYSEVVFSRDVIQHLDIEDIRKFIRNSVKINEGFLILNHYPELTKNNEPLVKDQWRYRPINLFAEPFNFPRPYKTFRDSGNKVTSVWKTEDIRKLDWINMVKEPKVLIAILARNKEHTLPDYLACISSQDYPKNKIVIYIRTNNNSDNTEEVLKKWIETNRNDYERIEIDTTEIGGLKDSKPHEWSSERFNVLGNIRNESLKKTIEHDCDYYFVIDCDNFIIPQTLSHLICLKRDIVAPMLRAVPTPGDTYSNFFGSCNQWGFYAQSTIYWEILGRIKIGCFKVPLVHCTYLIDRRVIDLLNYIDSTGNYEFVVFSRSARCSNVEQYITNELDFGTLLHPDDKISLEDEAELFHKFKNEKGIFGRP